MPGNHIKFFREKANLTQQQLADKMGTNQPLVQRHEKRTHVSVDWARKYGDALGIHYLDIIEGPAGATVVKDATEAELLETFRGLDDSAKSMYLHTIRSFAEKHTDQKTKK